MPSITDWITAIASSAMAVIAAMAIFTGNGTHPPRLPWANARPRTLSKDAPTEPRELIRQQAITLEEIERREALIFGSLEDMVEVLRLTMGLT